MLIRLSWFNKKLSTTIYSWDSGSSPNWAGVRDELRKNSIFTFPAGGWLGGWVGVEIEVNANSAPNWVWVGAGAELAIHVEKFGGKNRRKLSEVCINNDWN